MTRVARPRRVSSQVRGERGGRRRRRLGAVAARAGGTRKRRAGGGGGGALAERISRLSGRAGRRRLTPLEPSGGRRSSAGNAPSEASGRGAPLATPEADGPSRSARERRRRRRRSGSVTRGVACFSASRARSRIRSERRAAGLIGREASASAPAPPAAPAVDRRRPSGPSTDALSRLLHPAAAAAFCATIALRASSRPPQRHAARPPRSSPERRCVQMARAAPDRAASASLRCHRCSPRLNSRSGNGASWRRRHAQPTAPNRHLAPSASPLRSPLRNPTAAVLLVKAQAEHRAAVAAGARSTAVGD